MDDHALFREGLQNYLLTQGDLEVQGAVGTAQEAMNQIAEHTPDVVLLDLRLGNANGLDLLAQIKRQSNPPRVLIVSSHDGDAMVKRAWEAGADGYISKNVSSAELVKAIRAAVQGVRVISPDVAIKLGESMGLPELTDREVAIIEQIAAGLSNKEVANKLGLSEKTVKNRLIAVFSKLNASDRTHAVVIAMERGFIDPS